MHLMPCTGSLAHSTVGIHDRIASLIGLTKPDEQLFDEMTVSASGVSASDVILDVGSEPDEYISGAIHIPYTVFLEENHTLKPLPVIAKILGDAGISRNDSVVIYGECMPCGGGPSTATFVYWIMRYAGHENVRILDGGIDAWKAAGRPTQNNPSNQDATVYELSPRPELLANYTYVSAGNAQLIDARPHSDYMAGTIPGSVNIPYEEVINGEKIKNRADLRRIFSGIDIERPVVVYTFTSVKASVVWFALTSLGYDARLYIYMDWHEHKGPIYSPEINRTITFD
ncbi:MAG: sulfurtransferase [Methanothrix sp.]|uniref:sulfurtransferase n=1 Tax=Methanothrix sp. TaxID=90426 RepID=UPI0019951575|nr:rhodanese-like domain-containing protein [Methanothrix sp.]MBC7080488.1 sulfurtransferase [Methanothrix sp.]NPU86978.1 sulfurtransferase [Methanothrix sp.]